MARFPFYWIVLSLLSVNATAQINSDDLLPPEEAFKVHAEMIDADTARIDWDIADGHFLYGSKVRVDSDTPGIEVGEAELPPGKVKHDEYFGEVETYRHRLSFEVPVTRSDASLTEMTLLAKSQGCADVGVCYPPQARTLVVQLPKPSAPAPSAGLPGDASGGMLLPVPDLGTGSALASGGDDGLSGLFGLDDLGGGAAQEDEFIDPDKAFVVSARLRDPNTIVVNWAIADDYYLYRHRFNFKLTDSAGFTIGEAQIPPGKEKEDEFFGTIQSYHHSVEVPIPVTPGVQPGQELSLEVGYQGCAEAGLCYPPRKKTLLLALDGQSAAAPAPVAAGSDVAPVTVAAKVSPAAGDSGKVATKPRSAPISESDSIAATLAGGNTALILLTFFGFGLLLTFTPCVFPMIPILSSIIVGQGSKLSTGRAFVMSLVYVLAMALTYTVAGVIAGVAGGNLQAVFQNPWVLGSFSLVFVLLSLSMFGFYELQLPSALQSKLTETSNKQHGGTLTGVAIMGLLSALIVGPCVAPPLMGALIYIGNTGDAVLGGAALFMMSMGMGVPLLIIGTLGGKWLPRAGAWMDTVKAVFGVALLGVAIWMLERILPGPVVLLLWATLFLCSAVYMGALDSLPRDASGWRRLSKGLGLVFAVYGVLLLICAATGGDDMLQPLHELQSPAGGTGSGAIAGTVVPTHASFQRIRGTEGLDNALRQASAAGKPVLLDFYADWCVECKRMERYTFEDPRTAAALAGVVLLQADVTENDDIDQALLARYSLLGPPALLFFDTQGKEMRGWRFVGYKDVDEFTTHVNGAFEGMK